MPRPKSSLPARLADVAEQARDCAGQAKAPNTLRAYRAEWRHFAGWCADHRLEALAAAVETVALYPTSLADSCRTSTLQRRLSAIAQAHKAAGHETPTSSATVRLVWQGIRRARGTVQQGKAAAVVDELRRMVATLPDTDLGARDRALLLLGFAGAFRRSELVALDVADAQRTRDGLVVTLRCSKTDQEGAGRKIGIPYGSNPDTCPVRAVATWIERHCGGTPALFYGIDRHARHLPRRLSDRAFALVVKRAAAAGGSRRTATPATAYGPGWPPARPQLASATRVVAQQTRHKSMNVLRRYIRDGSLFRENAAAAVGL